MADIAAAAEFSRLIEVERIGEEGVCMTITADVEERAALARRFDLLSLDRLVAEVQVQPKGTDGSVVVDLDWQADVVQRCVVSLEPVAAHLAERSRLVFSDRPEATEAYGGEDFDLESEEPPEPLVEGRIDVGELTAEQMALALDPYPRRPDARLPEAYAEHEPERRNPFAALAKLKEKQ